MQQIYEILQKLVDKKGEGLDFNEPPFILNYKYGNIQNIKVKVEPTQFTSDPEKAVMPFIPQLNAFLPTFQWNYELHLDQRYIEFTGEDKPPELARWPGSWLRHFRYMPMGLSGKGEIAYQPDSIPKSSYGRSQFKNEHGDSVGTDTSLTAQPQGLICGAPLGLDTIIPTTKGYRTMETIEVGDYVFDINNKPVKVLGKSEINYNPDKVYKLEFLDRRFHPESIVVISDGTHRFPIGDRSNYIEKTAEELEVGDNILESSSSCGFQLYKKEEIEKQPVQCILVDSNEHLFLITDESHMHKEWKGGDSYPYDSIYTRNTGGGKSVSVQNVLIHCIEHRNKIALGLIDPKQVEFSNYKGMNGVVGVATSTLETVELLRVARQVMLKRNKEMSALGIKSLTDYKPSKKTNTVFVTGREYNENDVLKVRISGEEKTMTAGELANYLHEEDN